jgi:hypothetical protein
MRRLSSLAAALALVAAGAFAGPASAAGDKLVIELKTGKVVIKLRPDLAPKHVEQSSALASQGFYDGVKWHRVIEGFMAQTGDPTGTGRRLETSGHAGRVHQGALQARHRRRRPHHGPQHRQQPVLHLLQR